MNVITRGILAAGMIVIALAPVSAAHGAESLNGLLPEPGAVEGWKKDGEPLEYTEENLWEYINGAAENFIAYDFECVIAQGYVSPDGDGLKVEIYKHAGPLMAFGIYTQFRSPGVTFFKVGNEAFGDPYSLHFWKGPYYVKIDVFEESEELSGAMKSFASAVAAEIEDAGEEPVEVGFFPREGMIEKSVTFITEGVLGRGKLPPAFIAEYKTADEEGKIYLFHLESETEASEVFEWYLGVISASAEDIKSKHGTYLEGYGKDPYRGVMGVFRYGRVMGILTGFGESTERMSALTEKAVERIKTVGERLKS